MKNLEGLNFYQILKIQSNASFIEIKRAYKEALAVYGEGSLATYSLFSDEERAQLLKAIEKAFLTLLDEDKRAGYDRLLVDTGEVDATALADKSQNKPIPLFSDNNFVSAEDIANRVKKKSAEKEVTALLKEVLGKDLISGDDLKRLRKACGIKILEINVITKISAMVLRSIEANRYESLPADVYLNNFLRSYAQILQIDSQRVIDGYYQNRSLVRSGA